MYQCAWILQRIVFIVCLISLMNGCVTVSEQGEAVVLLEEKAAFLDDCRFISMHRISETGSALYGWEIKNEIRNTSANHGASHVYYELDAGKVINVHKGYMYSCAPVPMHTADKSVSADSQGDEP
ncbi:MAG: hypothetical protein HRU19_01270 [Pseudobacteriovorax sp.]|nr:hypothetical protein [Pseudobacteriovorax sp.]